MSPSLFGTDGVRGVANSRLTPELAFNLVRAATGFFLERRGQGDFCPRIIMGRDTRRSGDMIGAAAASAAMSCGVDVIDMGVVPTPAVAHATASCDANVAGLVISASHNPSEYNGIKFFDASGYKLAPQDEGEIERGMGENGPRPQGSALGRLFRGDREVWEYLEHLTASLGLDRDSLAGLRVAMDCANGAGYRLGPAAFRSAGASVTSIFDSPDGDNINVECGSTKPESLIGMMTSGDYDVGFALDGDADRLVAVSPLGKVLDGDDLLYIIARDMIQEGELANETVVVTMINNLGLGACLEPLGVETVQCPVGDREIMIKMRETGANLGGEISGHLVLGHCATTGDGILSALTIARALLNRGQGIEEMVMDFTKYPQIVENVPVSDREGLEEDQTIEEAISRGRKRLGESGRIIVRPSGTEPVIRILVEGPDRELIEEIADDLADIVAQRLG
ncbi:MAG: phosphoglucosamine mutase [Clostridia bacterium]